MSTTPANDAVSVREAAQALVDAHPVRGHHIAALKAALAATEHAAIQPAGDTADKWRTLALQYDGHRMQAIWHLQAMLQDAAKHAPIAAEFLQAAPSSAPVAQAMPSQPPNVTSGSSFMVQMDSILRQAESHADGKISTAAVRETILAYQAVQAMPAAPSEAVSVRDAAQLVLDRYDELRGERGPAAEFEILRHALQGKPEAQAGE